MNSPKCNHRIKVHLVFAVKFDGRHKTRLVADNVQVEWETREITYEPLSIIAADDPVTCAAHAKENDLLALEGWCRFRNIAKKD